MLTEQGPKSMDQSDRGVSLCEVRSWPSLNQNLPVILPGAVMLSRRYFRRVAKAVFRRKKTWVRCC